MPRKPAPKTTKKNPPEAPRRLAKAIADAGVCSRRKAEELIAQGHVELNGVLQTSPAVNVCKTDEVRVQGRPLNLAQKDLRVFAYHKPTGVICAAHDPQDRTTVFDTLPKNTPRLVLVGRLDLNSEGLLLLTNNGDFAGKLMHPKNEFERIYKVRFRGTVSEKIRAEMANGPTIEGHTYRAVVVTPLNTQDAPKDAQRANTWVEVKLMEGKNREIRKVFEHFGLQVNRLIRTSYGTTTLGDLPPKALRELTPEEIASLQKNIRPE